jgi:hypothetical protein
MGRVVIQQPEGSRASAGHSQGGGEGPRRAGDWLPFVKEGPADHRQWYELDDATSSRLCTCVTGHGAFLQLWCHGLKRPAQHDLSLPGTSSIRCVVPDLSDLGV